MIFRNQIIIIFCLIFNINDMVFASAFEYSYTSDGFKYVIHRHNESSYQHAWCIAHNGIEEFENPDKTRVDCLTDTHAIEFDFANKWAESIGQALHYSKMTGKKAKVILILENPEKQMCYFERVQNLGKIHNFDVEFVTPEILNIQDGKCQYKNCKCHKIKTKKHKFLNRSKHYLCNLEFKIIRFKNLFIKNRVCRGFFKYSISQDNLLMVLQLLRLKIYQFLLAFVILFQFL